MRSKAIYICTDSTAARKAVRSYSKIVQECVEKLDNICRKNRLNIVWERGHAEVKGNEMADALTREGSSTQFHGPEP